MSTAPRARSSVTRKRTPRSERAELTRERILDTAEALFSKIGFFGVTLKQIAQKVGVDTALVHYYFGNKSTLFDEVLDRRAQILNSDRVTSLERYDASTAEPTIEGALECFLRPLLQRVATGGPGWKNYFALIAQISNTPDWGGQVMTQSFDPIVQRFIELLRRILPDCPKEELYWGFHMLTGAITLTLSESGRIDRLSNDLCRASDVNAIYRRMVPYAADGLRALCRGAHHSIEALSTASVAPTAERPARPKAPKKKRAR